MRTILQLVIYREKLIESFEELVWAGEAKQYTLNSTELTLIKETGVLTSVQLPYFRLYFYDHQD